MIRTFLGLRFEARNIYGLVAMGRYRAEVKLRAGKLEQAMADVKKAMELDPKSSSLYR